LTKYYVFTGVGYTNTVNCAKMMERQDN